jgi:hypothetical protein
MPVLYIGRTVPKGLQLELFDFVLLVLDCDLSRVFFLLQACVYIYIYELSSFGNFTGAN